MNFAWPTFQNWLGGGAFVRELQPVQAEKLALTGVVLLVLLALGYRRKELFLVAGDVKASIRPAPWMGFPTQIRGCLLGVSIRSTCLWVPASFCG